MHKEIFKNAFFQAFARIVTTGLGFLITILVARYFGADSFGDFSKITSYVALYYLFVDFGLNAIFLKEAKSFSTLLYLRILIASVIFIFANLIANVLPYNPILNIGFSPLVRFGIFIYSFSLFAQAIIFSTASIFQKNLRYEFYVVSQIVGGVINFFLIGVLVFFAKSLELVIFSFLVSTFITAIVSLLFIKERFWEFDFPYSKKILISSIPLGLMLIFNLIYFRIDIFILSFMKPNVDVALYSLAYKFFDFFIALPLFLSNALYPKLLQSISDKKSFYKILKTYLPIYLILSIIFLIPVWFLSPLFSLVSSEFSKAYIPFRILILSLPIFFITSFLQWVLISIGKQKRLSLIYATSLSLNIFLNLLFIPRYSYIASSVATGVSEAFVLVFLIIELRRSVFKNGK